MTRARNISNPQAVTLPLTVSANITSNASLAVGNTSITGTLTASANVNLDSGTLFVDGTNNRVGINNAAPTQALTVTGNTFVNGAVTFANSTGNTTLFFANGFVGFGNSTPASKIHVAGGSIGLDTDQAIRTGNTGIWMVGSTATEISIGSQSANSGRNIGLYSNATSTPAVYCASNNNIGINTVTDLYHRLNIASGTSYTYSAGSWPSGATMVLRAGSNSNNDYSGIRFTNPAGAREGFIGYVQTSTNTNDFIVHGYNGSQYKEWSRTGQFGTTYAQYPAFSAYKSGNLAYPSNGTLTRVESWISSYDTNGNFSTTTGRFTAPVSGYYIFMLSFMVAAQVSNNDMQTRFYRNGSYYVGSNHMFAAAYNQVTLSCVMYLSKDDYMESYIYGNGTAGSYVYTDRYSHIHGALLG